MFNKKLKEENRKLKQANRTLMSIGEKTRDRANHNWNMCLEIFKDYNETGFIKDSIYDYDKDYGWTGEEK